jgi:hypothetical protein
MFCHSQNQMSCNVVARAIGMGIMNFYMSEDAVAIEKNRENYF